MMTSFHSKTTIIDSIIAVLLLLLFIDISVYIATPSPPKPLSHEVLADYSLYVETFPEATEQEKAEALAWENAKYNLNK